MADTNQLLEQILSEIQDNNGGFKSSIRRTVSQSVNDIEDKIKKLLTKSERNIRNVVSQKIQGSNRNYGNVIGNIEGNVGTIKDKAINIAKGVDNLNSNITTLTNLLQQIEGHINQNLSQNSPTNSTNNTSNNTTIETTVKDILTELKGIHTALNTKNYDQNDDELLKKLNRIHNLRADRELKEEIYKNFLQTGKVPISDGSGGTIYVNDKKHVKDYKKEKRKEDRDIKKRRESIEGKSTREKIHAFGYGSFMTIAKDKPDSSALIEKGIGEISKLGGAGAIAGTILQAVKALFDLGAKQDKATTEFARAVGGFKQGKITAGRSVGSMIETSDRRRGYTAEAAYSAMTEIAEARGRTTERLSSEALKSAIDLRRFGIGADVINNFDTFGKSIEDTDKYFAKLYSEVSKKGLSFKNVSKAVNDNLKAAQSHTFANGLRGLEAMAERSVQLKYNMQQVFQFADKVSDIEGSIG